MTGRNDINDFLTRWQVEIPNQRLFNEFRNRVSDPVAQLLSDLHDIATGQQIDLELEDVFAEYNGSHYESTAKYRKGSNIQTFVDGALGFLDLVIIIQRLFWAAHEARGKCHYKNKWDGAFTKFVERVNRALDLSPGVNIRKIELNGSNVELYPEGIRVMDDVVDSNAVWLRSYPSVLDEYQKALAIVAGKQTTLHRQALDSLRFALEKLLKIVFENNAPLEKQKEQVLRWMKSHGVHAQIRNSFVTLLDQLCAYQNASVKHDSNPDAIEAKNWSPYEVEFMIYLTSTFMRLIMEVKNASA